MADDELSPTSKSHDSEPRNDGARRDPGERPTRVLVVEDDQVLRTSLQRVLERRQFVVVPVCDGLEALERLEREPFDVVLLDVQMPRMSGPELLARAKASGFTAEIVMMSATADMAVAVSAVKAGAYGFLTKPFFSDDALLIELRKAAETKRLREKTRELQRELAELPRKASFLAGSPAMQEVMRLVSGVATTDSTILVLGESGTGKELIARAIHERSRRAARPFIAINCGAIPADLIESELFGHARGAFTSAVAARAGVFEAANGGTLLLDEVGDLPTSAQVKLLRALQEGEIKPVGSDQVKTVDVRVIAATNADLKAATSAGTFRKDLYYRLNVIPLVIPPLRERGDDILLLARHFLRRHAAARPGRPLELSAEAEACLEAYAWPGNVRELEHAIEHAIVLCPNDRVTPADLPADVRGAGLPSRVEAPAAASVTPPSSGTRSMAELVDARSFHRMPYSEAKQRIIAEFNEAYVRTLVGACGGNISEAARRSELDRSNFRRLLREIEGGGPARAGHGASAGGDQAALLRERPAGDDGRER